MNSVRPAPPVCEFYSQNSVFFNWWLPLNRNDDWQWCDVIAVHCWCRWQELQLPIVHWYYVLILIGLHNNSDHSQSCWWTLEIGWKNFAAEETQLCRLCIWIANNLRSTLQCYALGLSACKRPINCFTKNCWSFYIDWCLQLDTF